MTEGPKYKLWALRLQKLRGQRLQGIPSQGCLCTTVFAWLGWLLVRIFKVGKELYLVFEPENPAQPHTPEIKDALGELASRSCLETGEQVLKVHFGHGGGYRVQAAPRKSHGTWGNGFTRLQHVQEPDFELRLSGGSLAVWFALGGHCEVASLRYLQFMSRRAGRDINAEVFHLEEALKLLSKSTELIVDAVMNQSLLPGVGNVIKIEGLYASGIHPLRMACHLSQAEALRLVRALRAFAIQWYEEPGQKSARLVKIYGKKTCRRCQGGTLKICEGTRQRITYFCPSCQPLFTRRWHARCREVPSDCGARDAKKQGAEGHREDDAEKRLLQELVRDCCGNVLEEVCESEAASDGESTDHEDSGDDAEHKGACIQASSSRSGHSVLRQTFY